MQRLSSILGELYGLVVDDGTLALAIVTWIAFIWVLRTVALLPQSWAGPFLFVGLVLILVENVLRRAGRSR